MSLFTGCATALITPFTSRGIDWENFARQIAFQLDQGVKALVVCGTTGEPSTMLEQEKEDAIAFVVRQTAGRVPVIAGTGSNSTAHTIEASLKAQELGADGLLLVTPYYNKTTQKGLVAHYTAVADAVRLPIILYNVPSRTGLNVKPATLAALANHPRIIAMKEASGDIIQVLEMVRLCQGKIDFYSGADEVTLPVMACGGIGVISVVSNLVPALMVELTESFLRGDLEGALALQLRLNPLIDALFCETNPIPVKTAMNLAGMGAGLLRPPLYDMEPDNVDRLRAVMRDFGFSV